MTTPGLAKFGRPGGLFSSHPADLSWARWGFRVIRQTHGDYAYLRWRLRFSIWSTCEMI